jgi:trigger factor
VEVDFKVLMGGVPIENGSSKKHALVLGKGVFIPGFEEQIIGMQAGDKKEFTLNFPEKYHQKELAGKPATFQVKVNLVQERQIPEVNDELAQSVGNFKNLVELKKSIKEGMEKEKIAKNKEEKRAQYLEAIIKKTTGELSDILIEEEVKR